MDVGEAVVAALEFEGKLFVINSDEVEDGGVEVVDADGVFGDVVGVVVGFADGLAGLDAAAGEPHGEAAGVVVTTEAGGGEAALAVNGASEFAAPDDERVIEKASLFEVGDEGSGSLIGFFATLGELFGETAVGVPAAMEELDEADAAFAEAAGHEGIVGVGAGFSGIFAVEFEGALGFA